MYFLGLHVVDWFIILVYFIGMVWIGKWTQKRISNSTDFYQGGRSFGKILFSFLNFGNITNADQAVGVTREIFRQGLSGLWFQNLVLFLTPFTWFSSIMTKRTRYLADGDIWLHRFESKRLAAFFSVYVLLFAVFGGAAGYILTAKTMKALMVKPAVEYTLAEQESVDQYHEYRILKEKFTAGTLATSEIERFELLQEKDKRGQLNSFISYLNVNLFYFLYAGIIASYTVLGGLFAAVITDVIQGLLILILSMILIPFGLERIGGFAGIHATVPDYMLELFSSSGLSEYTWYFVMAMVIINLIGLAPMRFMIGGSAKDDKSARYGAMIGSFSKRFIYIGWVLTGVIAIGLYSKDISDPGLIWGVMTRDMLGVGLIGVMVAAILAANMSSIDAASLSWGAVFTQNILKPYFPGITEKRQVLYGRIVIFAVLFASIYFAYTVNDIFEMFKKVLSIGIAAGAPAWLAYFWKRLNTKAVAITMFVTIMMTAILPNTLIFMDSIRTNPNLTIATVSQKKVIETKSIISDVEAGLATETGLEITKTLYTRPIAIYFSDLVHENPYDMNSPMVGKGSLRTEMLLIGAVADFFDWDLRNLPGPMIQTLVFWVQILLPFILMLIIGSLTKPNSKKTLQEFYTNFLTPTIADQEKDQEIIAHNMAHPEIIDARQYFPQSNWVIPRVSKRSWIGFTLCWVLVFAIVGLFVFIFSIGK
ncbi:sodium:solute symporter family protein [bacterium]|nr:sodium:solute symporter family protein [bacterium]